MDIVVVHASFYERSAHLQKARTGRTDRFLKPAQVVDGDLLLLVVPAPHGQHCRQHVGDRKGLLGAIGRHDEGCSELLETAAIMRAVGIVNRGVCARRCAVQN